MSSLKFPEKQVLERIFDRHGYVLDFSNRTFEEFFKDHDIQIYEEKYASKGNSKMNRLRTFWEIEPDNIVGNVLESLLEYAIGLGEVDNQYREKAEKIISRLKGENAKEETEPTTEKDFLKQNFEGINWQNLSLDILLQPVIEQRIKEIHKALENNLPLSVIFLSGSTLEGLLLDLATKHTSSFRNAESSPKYKENKVKSIEKWSLNSLIDVAHEIGFLSLDVKKYSHSLRDFRNYIHPREQALNQFNPDIHTAKISFQVLRAAIAQISKKKR